MSQEFNQNTWDQSQLFHFDLFQWLQIVHQRMDWVQEQIQIIPTTSGEERDAILKQWWERIQLLLRPLDGEYLKALAHASLMPEPVPMKWIMEWVTDRSQFVQLASQAGLIAVNDKFFTLHPLMKKLIQLEQDPHATQTMLRSIRAVIGRMMANYSTEKKRLFGYVVNGNQDQWYVAPIAEQQLRAAETGLVRVINEGGGTSLLILDESLSWEEAAFQQFVEHQFKSEDSESILWVLQTEYCDYRWLTRMKDIIMVVAQRSAPRMGGMLTGCYWLALATASAKVGFGRACWGEANQALEIFKALDAQFPNDSEIEQWVNKAGEKCWLYDW